MKNLAIILGLLTSILSFSQEIKWGVKGGMNINNLSDADNTIFGDSKIKLGVHFGGFLEYPINERFSIQPELLFSTQGAKFDKSFAEDNQFASIKKNINLTYLTLPIMLKYKLIEKLKVEFGPQLGLALSMKEKLEGNLNGVSAIHEIDGFEDRYVRFYGTNIKIPATAKRFNLGLNIGASYDITENIFVQARYNFDLTKIVDYPANTIQQIKDIAKDNQSQMIVIDKTDMKNSVFQISVGYKF